MVCIGWVKGGSEESIFFCVVWRCEHMGPVEPEADLQCEQAQEEC